MRDRRRRLWPFALVALAATQVGAPCQPPPPVTIRIANLVIVPVTESYYVGTADVEVQVDQAFQAFDFELGWDSSALVPTQLAPHPEFDDDGAFSLPVSFALAEGKTSAVVDVRHGPPAPTGTTRVASVTFMAPQGLPGSLWVTGSVAAPDGSLLPISSSAAVATP
jgi:hypothetical protein